MQWSGERQAGFTAGDAPPLPVIDHGPYGYTHVNVAAQRRDPVSMLNWLERMLRMRKEVPEVGWGEFAAVDCGRPDVFALRYTWRNNSVVFVHNLSAEPQEIRIKPDVHGLHDGLLVNLLSDDNSEPDGDGKHCILMEPYGYRWFRVGGLDYLLRRTEV